MLIYTSPKEKAMINPLTLVVYIVLSIYVLVSDGAVQKAPEVSFFAEHIYKFDYHSHTEIATGITLTFSAQVSGFVFCSLFTRCYGNTRAKIFL